MCRKKGKKEKPRRGGAASVKGRYSGKEGRGQLRFLLQLSERKKKRRNVDGMREGRRRKGNGR